jgi:hypothetical protein
MHWDTRTTQNGDGTRFAGVISDFFWADTYVHAAWTARAGENNRFYKNGALTSDGTVPAAAYVDLHDVYDIGRVDNWFYGTIDEVIHRLIFSLDSMSLQASLVGALCVHAYTKNDVSGRLLRLRGRRP